MTKLHAASLVDLAREEVERRIYEGELAEGKRIVIDQLARELGISAVPLREALARLHAQKLVKFEPNRGYSVLPPPDAKEMAALFDIRLAFEAGALELLELPQPEARLAPLRRINDKLRVSTDIGTPNGYRDFAKLNLQFHKGILALADAPGLLAAYENLGYHQLVQRMLHTETRTELDLIACQHDAILTALASNSRDAARTALVEHIRTGKMKFDR